MDDVLLRYAEYGILGVITLLMLTRGLTVLAKLIDTTKALTDSITKLTQSVNDMGQLINKVFFHVMGIEQRMDKFEESYSRNFTELRDLLKGKLEGRR